MAHDPRSAGVLCHLHGRELLRTARRLVAANEFGPSLRRARRSHPEGRPGPEGQDRACHERGLLQALRRYGSCEEWNCAWLSTLSLPLVRLQFHNDAAAWQAACDEGAGLASLRHGQRELWLHRAHSRRQRRGGSELGPRRSAQASRAINQG